MEIKLETWVDCKLQLPEKNEKVGTKVPKNTWVDQLIFGKISFANKKRALVSLPHSGIRILIL